MTKMTEWTSDSVLKFAKGQDPVVAMMSRAQHVVFEALDAGWSGPPFDPVALAELLGIDVQPRQDVIDAQITSQSSKRFILEYNPTRPRGRVRYSIAHEIAHTLFPDCSQRVRKRLSHDNMEADDWQLEALCNIGAAEFLMPVGSWEGTIPVNPGIASLLGLRGDFDVSMEAVLLRFVRLSRSPCAIFCASRLESGRSSGRYRLDYVVGSKVWSGKLRRSWLLPADSSAQECTAIGYTAKSDETWAGISMHLESVGIPPYPGRKFPRVAGIASLQDSNNLPTPKITYLTGDATEPRGDGRRVVVQIVNDSALTWGGRGFQRAVRSRWPDAQRDYKEWAESTKLKLGSVRQFDAGDGITLASVVAQHGYGPSAGTRIRYEALSEGLRRVASYALQYKATLHMPRIGCGEAGGAWSIVQEIILAEVCTSDIKVTVYDLAGDAPPQFQPGLGFSMSAKP